MMTVVKKIFETSGDGITERKITKNAYGFESFDDNEALKDELETMLDKMKQPWRGKIDWVEKIRFRALELAALAPDWDENPEFYNEYFAARRTEAWYFCEMARLTKQIELEIKSGLGWDAVSSAMQLGELATEWRFKNDWEPAALFGDEQMGARKRGGESHRKYPPELIASFIENLLDPANGGGARSKSEAVSVAAKNFGISSSSVYRMLKLTKDSTHDASDKSP